MTSQTDKLNCFVSVSSGILCSLLDIVWIGEFSLDNGRNSAGNRVDRFVVKVASLLGCEDDGLKGSISLSNKGFEGGIIISDLVRKAGVSRSSFYRNFTDKNVVIYRKMERLLQEWKTEFECTKNQDFSDSLLQHFYDNKDFYLLLYRSGLSFMVLDNIKKACGVNPDTPPILAYGAASIAGALFGWADEWIARGMKETPQELKKLAKEFNPKDIINL